MMKINWNIESGLSLVSSWFQDLINLQKSEIIPIGGMEDVDRAIVLFGCKVRRFPTSYLGLPLGAPHRSIGVWNVIEERFKRKLPTWKKQYLSKGGRLVLIKSTLSSLPIYFMSNVGQP